MHISDWRKPDGEDWEVPENALVFVFLLSPLLATFAVGSLAAVRGDDIHHRDKEHHTTRAMAARVHQSDACWISRCATFLSRTWYVDKDVEDAELGEGKKQH
jgi:hypothetical protein